jgi:hypothetical protein
VMSGSHTSNMLGPHGQSLVGLRINAIFVSPGEHSLYLVTDRSGDAPILALYTEGDCCSESWWADVTGVMQLLFAQVARVEDIEVEAPEDGRGRQESDEAYGLRITTDQGAADLVFRNSSNGYYGGWCTPDWSMSVPDDAKRITRDWRA